MKESRREPGALQTGLARLVAGRSWWVLAALIVALGAAIYYPVRGFGFLNLDDSFALVENPWMAKGLSWESLGWAFKANLTEYSANAEYWQPLTLLSRLLDAQLYGLNAGAFHVTSVLLHLLNAFLVAVLIFRLTGAAGRAVAVALIFLVHPQNVEPVCWLAARKDLLNATFYLCTLLAYGRYARQPNERTYGLVLLTYLACLAAKPMGVSLPFVLLVLDWWPLRREAVSWTQRLLEKVPLMVLAGVASVLAMLAQADWGAVSGAGELPFIYRAQNAVFSYALYVRRLFWPGDLAIYYPHPVKTLGWGEIGWSLAFLVVMTVVAWVLRRRKPVLLAGWLWFGLILGPVIGLMQIGAQGMADRYFYLSGLGLITAVVWLVADVTSQRLRLTVLAIAVTVLTVNSAYQVRFWRDSRTVFDHAAMVTRGNSMAHLCLGLAEYGQGPRNDARAHLKQAVAISPSMVTGWETLGRIEVLSGHYPAAIKAYAGALSMQNKNTANMAILGSLLKKVGKPADAEKVFRKMLEVSPKSTEALYYLGDLYAEQRRWPEAVVTWEQFLATNPKPVSGLPARLAQARLAASTPATTR